MREDFLILHPIGKLRTVAFSCQTDFPRFFVDFISFKEIRFINYETVNNSHILYTSYHAGAHAVMLHQAFHFRNVTFLSFQPVDMFIQILNGFVETVEVGIRLAQVKITVDYLAFGTLFQIRK